MSCRTNLVKLLLLGSLGAIALAGATASAFPSLFNRTPLFRRMQQQQQQQQQQQAKLSQQDQLKPVANSVSPSVRWPVELMRLPSGPQQIGAHPLDPAALQHRAQFASGQLQPAASLEGAFPAHPRERLAGQSGQQQIDAAAAYYRPNVVALANAGHETPASPTGAHLHHLPGDFQGAHEDALFQSAFDNSGLADDDSPGEPAGARGGPQKLGLRTASTNLRYAPSHANQIVDKIEQHIGQHIEKSLAEQPPAGFYEHQRHTEKEAAATSAGGSKSAEAEEAGEAAGGEPEAAGAAHEAEKRHEEEHKHEEHKHEEHPPEAFEVHHKKGGKSFQYFHQGHQHP